MQTVAGTSFIEPFTVEIDVNRGEMPRAKHHIVRRASDMRGHYADQEALERLIADSGDPVHYEVFEVPVPEEYGHLMYCISTLQPGTVGDECFMTKGHYHTVVNTGETYLCLRGEGYMIMKTSDGRFNAQPMVRDRMVYVPPYWAHRSVNTGDEPLVSYCVYGAEAGHNYGDIEQEGFIKRVYRRSGAVEIV
ncbi:MAG: glucose-6-phosphate isomerase [Spirochaetaceae bacterium]|nr:MAG: glucose-6-phosphate isomerase [Spirochaetaceae bacterium]